MKMSSNVCVTPRSGAETQGKQNSRVARTGLENPLVAVSVGQTVLHDESALTAWDISARVYFPFLQFLARVSGLCRVTPPSVQRPREPDCSASRADIQVATAWGGRAWVTDTHSRESQTGREVSHFTTQHEPHDPQQATQEAGKDSLSPFVSLCGFRVLDSGPVRPGYWVSEFELGESG